MSTRMSTEVYLKAVCSDKRCQSVIYLTSITPFVDCFRCGQQQDRICLQNVQVLSDHEGLEEFLNYSFVLNAVPKRGPDMVKVLGLSNYYCKLLSPFLTIYGMDRATQQPKLLTDMGRGEIFDCSSLSSRAFLIDPKHISIPGFGRDVTGSMDYLSETLERLKVANGGEERLLPIYADGDGHCLVHAISRALVGRELFWHPLRSCLKRLFVDDLDKFKDLFQNFIDTDEWHSIIEECDPDFQPPEGDFHGLRNIHIFGLANILKRPIILLDSWECMNKSGDYSGLFLPGFVPPEKCRGEDNSLNKPICIAWSSKSHNHYIPLVGILNSELPVIHRSLLPSVFRMPQTEISNYIEFDENDNCVIGGNRVLSDDYIECLVFAMETQFTKVHGVHPSLVADAKHFFYYNNVFQNPSTATIIRQVRNVVNNGCLFRCNTCTGFSELHLEPSWFKFGGLLYTALEQEHEKFVHGKSYLLPIKQEEYINCKYDSRTDSFIPDISNYKMSKCNFCQRPGLKRVERQLSQEMKNSYSDKTSGRNSIQSNPGTSETSSDHSALPRLKIEWNDKTVEDVIPDFQLVNEDILSNAIDNIAESFIKKHFSGEVADNMLQNYISGEIYKTIGKTPIVSHDADDSNGESAEEIELDPEEITELETKLGNASNEIPSEPSTSQIHTVKLVSINGREVTLDLNEKGITYPQLQDLIQNKFSIPVANQRIKMGFPPKVLEPPHGNEGAALPLKHGDRLIIENHPVQENKRFASTPYIRNNAPLSKPTECNSELWKVAKTQPHLFKRGGIYFEEADKKHILTDMKHVTIDSFPSKHFSYNQKSECLEVCLKPIGHFEMGADFDSRFDLASQGETVSGYRMCPIMSLLPGRTTMKPNKTNKDLSGTVAENKSNQGSVGIGLIRKGPGVSLLTSPEPSDMDIS